MHIYNPVPPRMVKAQLIVTAKIEFWSFPLFKSSYLDCDLTKLNCNFEVASSSPTVLHSKFPIQSSVEAGSLLEL